MCLLTIASGFSVESSGAAKPPKAAPKSILSLPKTSAKLPNGLRVYFVKYPSRGVVAYQLPVHAGSRNEVEKGKTGFAHFFEHLMFRGTKHMSGKAFGELYAKLGAENNAWTWYDMTNYHGVVASIYLPKIMAAEADRFQNLEFDEKQLKDEASAVLGEYNKDVAQPEFMLEEKLQSTAFTEHPYAHTTMGYRDDILKFTERYKDVWPFFKRYYRPSNVSIVLVGDVDFDKDMKLIKEQFGGWKDPEIEPVKIPEEPKQKEPRSAEVRLTKPTQTRLTIAYKVPPFTTKNTDSAALSLIAEMAFSVTSDFQKTYRFDKKWLDSVDAGPMQTVDPGLWTINLRFSDEGEKHYDEILKAVNDTVAEIARKPPSPERLAATKRRFRNAALTTWFSSPDKLADRIAWFTNFEPDLGALDRVFERIDEVTPETIKKFANEHLVDSGKTVITLRGGKS
jgi:zinc protease